MEEGKGPTAQAGGGARAYATRCRPASSRRTELGCPYEAALALGDADEEEPLRRGLDQLLALGARPAAAIIARRLRERGARDIPALGVRTRGEAAAAAVRLGVDADT